MKICPICDTENKPQATHCDVCGERLTPPKPGEATNPEENVLAMLGQPEAAPGSSPEPKPASEPAAAQTPSAPPEPQTPAPAPAEAPPVRAQAPARTELSEEDLEKKFAELEATVTAERAAEPTASAPPAVSEPEPKPTPTPRPTPQPAKVEPARIISSGIPDARLVVYKNKEPAHTHPVVNDETLIGRYDALSGSEPDLDLTEFDPECVTSRKHAYIYRQNREYYLYPVSNAGTQLNDTMVGMGEKTKLSSGDVIILAAKLAMKFHIDD